MRKKINKMDLSIKASKLRKKLGENGESPIDIFNLVQQIDNLTLIFHPLGENIGGVCYKGKNSNVIVINSKMSLGRQRFSLAHELYHAYFDDSEEKVASNLLIGDGDENEKKADQFASYFLMPPSSLDTMIEDIKNKENKEELTIEDVIKIEQYYGVSHKAILYRLLEEGYIKSKQTKNMESGIVEKAKRLGYETNLYRSFESEKSKVLGYYIASSDKLLEKNFISQGKYEELLLDAFRDDIVYGIDEEDISLD